MMKRKIAQCISALLVVSSLNVLAEENDENRKASSEDEGQSVIITGSSIERSEADTPAKTTWFGIEEIANTGFKSQADILLTVPGIKVEGGGGEVATNAFVRGLPSGGQFQFTPLNYDGMPAFQSGMTSSAQDVYYRPDIGIERVEYVGGGVSNLFGPGSVAGIINYISKKGSGDAESTIQLEMAENGRYRTDFYTSGPISNDDRLYYAMSGYYRYDEGPLDVGLPTKGYQLRGNIHKEFNNGFITFYAQMIDDKVQFYLPLPLDGQSRSRLTGNNGETVYVGQTVAAAELAYPTATGRFESPIRDGVATDGGSFAIEFERELSSKWTLGGKAKYADYAHQFNLFLDGDGIANSPEPLDGYVTNASRLINGQTLADALGTASFTFSETGNPVPSDYLLFGNRLLDRQRDGDFFSNEFNLTGLFNTDSFDHTVNLGTFFITASQMDFNIISSYLADFSNGGDARLVDLSFTDGSRNVVQYSRNGIVGPGTGYNNKQLTSKRTAFYVTDQMENDTWAVDLGFRLEKAEGSLKAEGNEYVTVSDDPSLAPNLQVNRTGNGRFTYGEVDTTEAAFSAAVLYKTDMDLNVYANASRGYFFPQLRSIRFDSNGEAQSYEGEDVTLGALGVKYYPDRLYLDASLFIANLDNRRSVDFENDGSGGIIERVTTQSTSTTGAEIIARWRMNDQFTLDGNVTFQNAEFSEGSLEGKEPRRQPGTTGNIGIAYNSDAVDMNLGVSYFGESFANDSNTVTLDSHSIATFNAGYTWSFEGGDDLRFGVSVWNLFDSDGITEGSPRQGNSQVSGGDFFVGRPILPRRISLTARYNF